jgi:hypothetical protein
MINLTSDLNITTNLSLVFANATILCNKYKNPYCNIYFKITGNSSKLTFMNASSVSAR